VSPQARILPARATKGAEWRRREQDWSISGFDLDSTDYTSMYGKIHKQQTPTVERVIMCMLLLTPLELSHLVSVLS